MRVVALTSETSGRCTCAYPRTSGIRGRSPPKSRATALRTRRRKAVQPVKGTSCLAARAREARCGVGQHATSDGRRLVLVFDSLREAAQDAPRLISMEVMKVQMVFSNWMQLA